MRTAVLALLMLVTACGPGGDPASGASSGSSGERISVFTHCGFYEITFDQVLWTPDSIERGTSPEGTGFNETTGVITRVDDRARFDADHGLTVWFRPAPEDLPPVPPCD